MNIILFVQIIAWIGAVFYGTGTLVAISAWYYFNYTKRGELSQMLMGPNGQTIVGYKISSRLIGFVICVAALISIYYA